MGVLTNVPNLPYNITNVDGLFDWISSVSPLFWPVILFVNLVILFTVTINLGASRALIVSSLISGIAGIFVAVSGWMDPKWMYLFGILLGVGMIWRHFESGE